MKRYTVFASLVAAWAFAAQPASAESIPALGELRAEIEQQSDKISSAMDKGFSYGFSRYFKARVPEQHLPDRSMRMENETGRVHGRFLQAQEKRALAIRFSKDNNEIVSWPASVTSWDGEVIRRYEPEQWSATILTPTDSDDNGVPTHYFARPANPFSWGMLPIDQSTRNTLWRYHDAMDLRDLLAMDGIRILDKVERLDDSNCIVIANDVGPFLWLDKDRGFVVKQYMLANDDEFDGVDYYHYYNETFTKVADGLWAVEHGFMLLRGPGIGYEHTTQQDYLAQISMRYGNIRFHESVDDEAFQMIFPAGTDVVTMDGNRGTHHTVGFLPNPKPDEGSGK